MSDVVEGDPDAVTRVVTVADLVADEIDEDTDALLTAALARCRRRGGRE